MQNYLLVFWFLPLFFIGIKLSYEITLKE